MSFFSKVLFGVDLDEEQQRGEQLDKRLAEENRKLLDRGVWTQPQYDQAEANRQAGATGDVQGEVFEEFKAGAAEGLQAELDAAASVSRGTRHVLGSISGSILGIIPWQLWLAGAVALFIYMGGGLWLKGRFLK